MANESSCAASVYSTCARAKPASAAIHAPARKSASRQAKRCASSPARYGKRIELRRFGVFNVRPRKTGIGRNPRTGQEVSIPPGKAVRFKPGKELQTL